MKCDKNSISVRFFKTVRAMLFSMRIIFLLLLGFSFCFPNLSFAQQDVRDIQSVQEIPDELVPCGDEGQQSCQACHLYQLVENIFAWVFGMLLVVGAIMIVIGGIRLVFSGGNQMAKRDARKMVKTAIISIILVGSAWTIIDITIATLSGQSDAGGIWTSLQCVNQPLQPPIE